MFRITLSDSIKHEVAEKIVEHEHPGNNSNGQWQTDGDNLYWVDNTGRTWGGHDNLITAPVTAFVDTNMNIFNEDGVQEGDEEWAGHVDFAEMELASGVIVEQDDNGWVDYRRF